MSSSRKAFFRGAAHALPFFVVIVPFAMLFGVLSSEAGLGPWETQIFSIAVFAGASQLAALQLMQDQAPLLVILATGIAVNLRMMMYSVALTPHLGGAPLGIRATIAYFLVDQSFALSLAEFDKRAGLTLPEKVAYFFGTIAPITAIWNVATAVGVQMGRAVPESWGLDFAMPITFIGMTAAMLRTVPHGVAMVVSVGVTLVLWAMPYGTGLLVGAAAGMAAGAIAESWKDNG
ncbi:AzlC family ABC transporter permease [Tabrizicola oligotrophica]|uniref:Branched-chain amino acid ABC transporter permease n=1 Tax=Tabrizicola oligotrophica TaxID=2710650 RepID=A0A6M0QTT5_9RHOB|nr:AzlC family ABC transporter permease [Tabrizicola oligotrophica]NEY90890.1 branched-chain amino acid ABC transporter permease [Tabrizicola oligotrophica]